MSALRASRGRYTSPMATPGEQGLVKGRALAFLKEHRIGVLATVSPSGQPRARTLYYTCDDAFCIYFTTLASTRKDDDIAANGRAAFVVSEERVPQTLQLEGNVADLTDSASIEPALAELAEVTMSNGTFFSPLTRFDSAKVFLYRLKPDWIRWGDFTHGVTSAEILSQIYP